MNLQLETPQNSSNLGRNISAAGSAQFQRAPVSVLNAPDPLGAAAEEISLHLAGKVESKTYSERRIRASSPPRTTPPEKIRHYLEKVGKLHLLEDIALISRRWTSNDDPTQLYLDGQDGSAQDPAERYLLLLHAREVAGSEGATPQALERIDRAITDVYEDSPEAIQARLATIDQAAGYGHDIQEVRQFQVALDSLLGQPTLSLALTQILDLAGRSGERLELAMQSIMRALGSCLSLTGRATEKTLLETLITDLYHLKALRTVLEDCRSLVCELRSMPDPNDSVREPTG